MPRSTDEMKDSLFWRVTHLVFWLSSGVNFSFTLSCYWRGQLRLLALGLAGRLVVATVAVLAGLYLAHQGNHEIRTPLNALLAGVQLVGRPQTGDAERRRPWPSTSPWRWCWPRPARRLAGRPLAAAPDPAESALERDQVHPSRWGRSGSS